MVFFKVCSGILSKTVYHIVIVLIDVTIYSLHVFIILVLLTLTGRVYFSCFLAGNHCYFLIKGLTGKAEGL